MQKIVFWRFFMPDTVKIFTNYEFEVNGKFKDLLTPPDVYGLALL